MIHASLKASRFEILASVFSVAQTAAFRGVCCHPGCSVRCNGHGNSSGCCGCGQLQETAPTVFTLRAVHRTPPPELRDRADPGYWIAKASASTAMKRSE